MFSELTLATCYAYARQGMALPSELSQHEVRRLKKGKSSFLEKMARDVSSSLRDGKFSEYFGNDCVLVPVPGHSNTSRSEEWISSLICWKLVNAKLAPQVVQMLRREVWVPKSADARPGERPGPQRHYDSLSINESLEQHDRVVLVDDVVTRGSTLMGCAMRLREQMPDAMVTAFAVFRTMKPGNDIDRLLDPRIETIILNGDELSREP